MTVARSVVHVPRPLCAVVLGLLAVAVLAGCTDAGPRPVETPEAGVGSAAGSSGTWNYTTPHPEGDPFTRAYEGRLTADEAAEGGGGLPAGASIPDTALESCCSMDFIEVNDLVAADQLLSIRMTVTWTNTEADRAGFDAAACAPWTCLGFKSGPDESGEPGLHQDAFTFITGGVEGFGAALLGVRFTNAAVTNGIPYAIAVEAVPIGNALRFADPYLIQVEDNATLRLDLVGPHATSIRGGLMFYGADDRPFAYHPFEGPHGSMQEFTLPGGEYVVFAFRLRDGFPRLASSVPLQSPRLELLAEEFGQVSIADVPDAQARSGTYDYEAPPGSLDTVPYFLYADGVAAQHLLGLGPERPGSTVSMTSSNGRIIEIAFNRLAAHAGGQVLCLQCGNQVATFEPANYLDDDGRYAVDWSSDGGAGEVVLFTVKYVR